MILYLIRLIIIDLGSLEEKDIVTYPVRLEYLLKD